MITMLFCNIARMDSYRGWTNVDQPVGAGDYPDKDKEEVHNFHPHDAYVYGYVAAVAHSISIERLGAKRTQSSVSGVDVVWTAPSPNRGRDVVGWYRNATVFRKPQKYKRGSYHKRDSYDYHVLANRTDYVLLAGPERRKINIQRAQDQQGGFGNSNVWYADTDYGLRIRTSVRRLFSRAKRQIFDRNELDEQAAVLPPLTRAPRGMDKPLWSKREVTVVGRDPEVQRWILQCADGRCELCGEPAPFDKPNGSPFLEIHHVYRLADSGADVPTNAVALCPNCHREAHHGARSEAILAQLCKHAAERAIG